MVDYYKILGLTLAKRKNVITDEMVFKNYSIKKYQYEKMVENNKISSVATNKTSSYEMQAIMDGDYLTLLNDAYNALKSPDARKHYDELVADINNYMENRKRTLEERQTPPKSDLR